MLVIYILPRKVQQEEVSGLVSPFAQFGHWYKRPIKVLLVTLCITSAAHVY